MLLRVVYGLQTLVTVVAADDKVGDDSKRIYLQTLGHQCRTAIQNRCEPKDICQQKINRNDLALNANDLNSCISTTFPKICMLGNGKALRDDRMYVAVKNRYSKIVVVEVDNKGISAPTGFNLKRTSISFRIDFVHCTSYIHTRGVSNKAEGILYRYLNQTSWYYMHSEKKRSIYGFVVSQTGVLYFILNSRIKAVLYRQEKGVKMALYSFSVRLRAISNDMCVDDKMGCVYWSTSTTVYRCCGHDKITKTSYRIKSNYKMNLPMDIDFSQMEMIVCRYSGRRSQQQDIVSYNLTANAGHTSFLVDQCAHVRLSCKWIFVSVTTGVQIYDRATYALVAKWNRPWDESIVNFIH